MTSSLTPKIPNFEHFEQIFADLPLFDQYNNEIILEKHSGDCSQYLGDHFRIKFCQN